MLYEKKWKIIMVRLDKKIILAFFAAIFSFSIFFASGVVESIDEWLYISVTRNMYYRGTLEAAPNEYEERRNVHFNSLRKEDGSWYSPSSIGYSAALLPAVFLSDMYRRAVDLPPSQHFPLETEWSLHLFASFAHVFWGAVLATIVFVYVTKLGIDPKRSLAVAASIFFLSNLFPLSNHSYPHIFETSIYMAILLNILLHSKTKDRRFLILGGLLAAFVLPIAYNITFLLLLPGIVLYFLLRNNLMNVKRSSLKKSIPVVLLLVLTALTSMVALNLLPTLISVFADMKPIILFEGVWGLLFSAGKSVFLYNPLLVVLVVFWWKIPKKYTPELVVFLTNSVLFIFFYGQSYMMDRGTIVPIWAGGNDWGVRYLAPLLPLGMMLALFTAEKLAKLQRLVVFYPLLVLALFVQILGVSLPYDLQYGSLPYTVDIFDGYHDRYNYASHIPRFSPLVTQSRYFIKRLKELPATLSHAPFNVRLYDGFSVPAYLEVGVVRSFGSGGGYLFFDQPAQNTPSFSVNLIGILDGKHATPSAKILLNGDTVVEEIRPQHNQLMTVHFTGQVEQGRNEMALLLHCDGGCGEQSVLLQELTIDGQKANLGSLDFPYVDHGTETAPGRKYFGVKTDYWALWGLRHGVFASTFDFWWLRYLYYWDLPKKFIVLLFISNTFVFLVSMRYLYRRMKW